MLLPLLFIIFAVGADAHVQSAIRSGQVPSRGVNLGGWLVTEYWINPNDAIWNGVDPNIAGKGEMAVMKSLGHAKGDPKFQNHWNTFITEADIAEIASFGLNTVRVPVGYWIIGYDNNDPSNQQAWRTFAPGGLNYLDKLINNWALNHNVAVLVSIHGAKGSQNGQDHSAPSNSGNVYWDPYPENIANTVEVARFLAARYKNSPAFLGLDLLNEPSGVNPPGIVNADKLKAYYAQAHSVIRATGNNCVLSASPLLQQQWPGAPNYWEKLTAPPTYYNAWQDWHLYLIWGFEGKSPQWLMNEGVATIRNAINGWNGNWLLVGEWSLASSQTFTDAQLTQYGKNMFGALKGAHSGWTYWTWKQGNGGPRGNGGGGWCMRCLLRDGIINSSMWS